MRTCFKCGKECNEHRRVCPECRGKYSGHQPELGQPLTYREIQICNLVAKGRLNKEIGFELGLAEGTVKEYMGRIFRKVGVSNRTELGVLVATKGVAA